MSRPHPFAVALTTLCLSACATDTGRRLPTENDLPTVPAMVKVKPTTKDSAVTDRVGQAALTPLSDLNVVQEEIPPALLKAQEGGPYAPPSPLDCAAVQADINDLDDALGADLDAARDGKKASLLDRGTDMAENTGVGMVRRTVEGFVPFRSWVRKLSGAERHSQKIAGAITAGGIRRAYLKGLRRGLGCPAPVPSEVPATPNSVDAGASAPSIGKAASTP